MRVSNWSRIPATMSRPDVAADDADAGDLISHRGDLRPARLDQRVGVGGGLAEVVGVGERVEGRQARRGCAVVGVVEVGDDQVSFPGPVGSSTVRVWTGIIKVAVVAT
jgi:hypothetical protein